MKQFVFTLQSLYDMQDGIEKQVKMQMSAVEAELARQLQEMEKISASFDRTKSEYCSAVAGGIQGQGENFVRGIRHALEEILQQPAKCVGVVAYMRILGRLGCGPVESSIAAHFECHPIFGNTHIHGNTGQRNGDGFPRAVAE
ncbi:hypothetical protein SDC9_193174 [bioreactor metagenome]|uniref:Uncharacterized protein n=1 Tax=bioreactor metagenome TaxID=1076179 RepID=A0A645I2S7_9ZZZZ